MNGKKNKGPGGSRGRPAKPGSPKIRHQALSQLFESESRFRHELDWFRNVLGKWDAEKSLSWADARTLADFAKIFDYAEHVLGRISTFLVVNDSKDVDLLNRYVERLANESLPYVSGTAAPLDIEVFLNSDDEHQQRAVRDALDDFLLEQGIENLGRVEWSGSLWAKIFARGSKEAIEKAAEALKAAAVDLPQAQAVNASADGAAKLIESLGNVPNGVIKLGNVVIVKLTSDDGEAALVTTDLTAKQAAALRRNPHWLGSPELLLGQLSAVEEPATPSITGGTP